MRAGLGSTPPERIPAELFNLLRLGISVETQARLADVSYYQLEIDFPFMKSAGIAGVIIRAGQRNWVDSRFRDNWRKAKEAGLPRGSYWLYDSREDPKKQAALWWSLVKDDPAELAYVADLEENYGGAYGKPEHFKAFILEFLRLSGVPDSKFCIYTGFFWWNERVGNDIFFRRFALWLAWYAPMSVVRVPSPWIESELLLWQYTASGEGPLYGVSSKEIDLNWFCGTAAQYEQRFNLAVIPDPDPQPTGGTMQGTVKSGYTLTVRDAVGADTGKRLYAGDVVYGPEPTGGRIYFSRIYRVNGTIDQQPGNAAVVNPSNTTEKYMTLVDMPEPTPVPDEEYILHVKNGVSRKFIPE